MALSNEDILNAIAEMSVMDVVELISDMEEKFGVSAAAAVAVAAPAAGGGEAAAAAGVVDQYVNASESFNSFVYHIFYHKVKS